MKIDAALLVHDLNQMPAVARFAEHLGLVDYRVGMKLTVAAETFPLARAFTISRGSRTEARVLTVTLEANGVRGRGECVPYTRYGETLESVSQQIQRLDPPIHACTACRTCCHPGAARNAIDCALWDLEAKRAGCPGWRASRPVPRPPRSSPPIPSPLPRTRRDGRRLGLAGAGRGIGRGPRARRR